LDRKFQVTLVAPSDLVSRLEVSNKLNLNTISIIIQDQTVFARMMRLSRYFYRSKRLSCDHLIVMGDLPYITKSRQTLFLQQANLIDPKVNQDVGRSFKFGLMRLVLKLNMRYCERVIVQTESMRQDVLKSYSVSPEKLTVVRHIVPEIDHKKKFTTGLQKKRDFFKFFYPASAYPHKNHQILWAIIPEVERLGLNVRFDLTLREDQIPLAIRGSKKIRCLGPLSPEDCYHYYYECDGLLFPSKLESYGLPLMESLLGPKIPVLAADRPYARELGGSLATFFDPSEPADLVAKIVCVINGQRPEVTLGGLHHLPTLVSWTDMSRKILD
jgi:glycosyltransferase involved in cell wall biosynthesis